MMEAGSVPAVRAENLRLLLLRIEYGDHGDDTLAGCTKRRIPISNLIPELLTLQRIVLLF